MAKTILILGHPDYEISVANRAITEEVHTLRPEVEIVNLRELYPDCRMNVAVEQSRLAGCQDLIFQFPIYWYSSPSILHAYVEQVFTHGFAYGSSGHALKDIRLLLSFTTGADEASYAPGGDSGITVDKMLPPFTAMARLCQMNYRGHVASFNMATAGPVDEARKAEVMARGREHAHKLIALAGI